jgi:hypothetical protein
VIRVFPDYGNPWPFWESAAENNTPTATELGLSDELESAAREWYEFWLTHYHWESGWDSAESADFSAASGDRMVEQLRREVASFADVEDARG